MKKTLLAIILILAMILCCGCDGSEEQPKNCTVGGSLQNDDFKITFQGIEEYVDTDEFAMDIPAKGKTFIVLKFTVEGIGDEDAYVNMFNEDSYCDDVAIDTKMLFDYEGDEIWGDVAVGKTRNGYVAYEVDKNWEKIEFIYQWDTWDDDATMTFTAYNKDLK